jgi:trimethylamine---corrinoid protein Co-methyltransferase
MDFAPRRQGVKRNLFAGQRRSRGIGLSMFSDDEIRMIHRGTLVVLERTGIWVELDEALDIFSDGGCVVDRESHIVKIPPHVVEDAVASSPESIVLCGRDPKNDILVEPGRVGFSNFGEGIKVIDPYSGELRPSTKKDLGDIAKLVDALPDIDVFEMAVVSGDQPPETFSLHNHEAAIVNQTKPISGGAQDGRAVRTTVEMLAAVQGGEDAVRERPMMVMGTCPVSPLKLVKDFCEIIIEAARVGLPSCVLSMAMAGGSSPVTLAGTLVTHNAEVLAGIVLAQLTERGSKVLYGSSTTAMDLRLVTASVGSPECALISAGAAQLARQYRLPSYIAGM